MNRFLFFIAFYLICSGCFGQIKPINKKLIKVNWDKTTHLIFPTEIKYFNSVNDFIVCDSPDKVKNILSVKANEKDWEETSNLSVVTADGEFYNFAVTYTDELEETNFFLANDSIIVPERIGINNSNDVHLIFPDEVKYIDFGSDNIVAEPALNLQNVVKVSLTNGLPVMTNVSVATSDRTFYTFDFFYDETQDNFSYVIGTPANNPVLLNKEDLTDRSKEDITDKLKAKGRTIYNLGQKKNKVEFSIQNVFVRDNKLIFRFSIINKSNIKYDIDYLKFYTVDKKKNKKTASQIIESQPLFIDNFSTLIEGKSENIFVVGFEKFTIPDNKYFIIEINEKNGGRHIVFEVNNNDIINAEPL
ncbi:MAG: conjugative transposon protein TraN [Dysgonomonas sp.]